MEKELHETTLFPRKALRPMSLAGLDNLSVYVLIITFPIGKSRKFTVPGGFSAAGRFSAVRFYGMEFLFVGGPQFPVFNGIMMHPALFRYVPQIGYGFIDRNVLKACKDALKNGSQ